MFRKTKEELPNMAQRKQQDLLSRLADRGEQVVGRITDLPGAKQLTDRVSGLTRGLDDVQKRLRRLDPLERRVSELERRLEKLEGKGKTTTRKTTAASATTKRSTSATRKTSGRSTGGTTRRSTGGTTRRRGTGPSST
jgi:uncharacterized protein YoxC